MSRRVGFASPLPPPTTVSTWGGFSLLPPSVISTRFLLLTFSLRNSTDCLFLPFPPFSHLICWFSLAWRTTTTFSESQSKEESFIFIKKKNCGRYLFPKSRPLKHFFYLCRVTFPPFTVEGTLLRVFHVPRDRNVQGFFNFKTTTTVIFMSFFFIR